MERNFIMSTKEIAYTILDNLNEEQLKAFVALFKDYYPNPDKLEKLLLYKLLSLIHI